MWMSSQGFGPGPEMALENLLSILYNDQILSGWHPASIGRDGCQCQVVLF